jgi:hypothetical protein
MVAAAQRNKWLSTEELASMRCRVSRMTALACGGVACCRLLLFGGARAKEPGQAQRRPAGRDRGAPGICQERTDDLTVAPPQLDSLLVDGLLTFGRRHGLDFLGPDGRRARSSRRCAMPAGEEDLPESSQHRVARLQGLTITVPAEMVSELRNGLHTVLSDAAKTSPRSPITLAVSATRSGMPGTASVSNAPVRCST